MNRAHLLAAALAAGSLCAMSAFAIAQTGTPDVVGQMGLKPGRWHTVVRFTAVTFNPVSGQTVPADLEAKIRSQLARPVETDDCIGAKRPPNDGLILPGISIGSDCALSDVVADRHDLKLRADCGGFVIINVKATHTEVAMTADTETFAFPAGAPFTLNVTATSKSSYVGECR